MANRKNKAVKKGSIKSAQDSWNDIEVRIKAWNAMYAKDDSTTIVYMTKRDMMIDDTKVYSYAEQYALDVASIVLHEVFQMGQDRQKRFFDRYCEIYDRFLKERLSDLKDDEDCWKSTNDFENLLAEACGKNYVPRAERYHMEIYYNGVKADEMNADDANVSQIMVQSEPRRKD